MINEDLLFQCYHPEFSAQILGFLKVEITNLSSELHHLERASPIEVSYQVRLITDDNFGLVANCFSQLPITNYQLPAQTDMISVQPDMISSPQELLASSAKVLVVLS